MSDRTRIAVPVDSGSGMEATRSPHFGHAAGFALVDVEDGVPGAVTMVTNPPHTQGGCMVTVRLLAHHGVTAVSAAGMGGGPFRGLTAAGITVHHDPDSVTVRQAVESVLDGRAGLFGDQHACGGHHH